MPVGKQDILTAYRCPVCGQTIMSVVGVFALTGDRIVLKCSSCKQSEMVISKTQDNKIRFNYPCMFCDREHTQIIPLSAILSRDLLTFPCPISGFDTLFMGTKGKVMKAIEESNDAIEDFFMKSEIESFKNKEDLGYDPHILDLVLFTLKDMAYSGNIKCDCEKGKYVCTIDGEKINIRCKQCSKYEDIDCSEGSMQARDLFERNSLILSKKYEDLEDGK